MIEISVTFNRIQTGRPFEDVLLLTFGAILTLTNQIVALINSISRFSPNDSFGSFFYVVSEEDGKIS